MGKISGLLIFMLMVNLLGYVLLSDYVDAYPATAGESKAALTANNPLLGLYGERTLPDGNKTYDLTENSSLYSQTPTTPPENFLSGVAVFIDRIFIMFDWIRAIIGVALFPVAMLAMLGLPWQLSMLLGVPLATLYILGIIDLFSSSGT
jgi:uncharacterized membrane protein